MSSTPFVEYTERSPKISLRSKAFALNHPIQAKHQIVVSIQWSAFFVVFCLKRWAAPGRFLSAMIC